MSKTMRRTLYECFHARVNGDRIYCDKGHKLLKKSGDGGIGIGRLISGKQMGFQVCQDCPDFEEMGPPISPKERGWVKTKE